MTERESSPMGVKPDASHLLDEHPRPLDHRDFLICHCFITHACDFRLATTVALSINYIASSVHPFHADVLQLHICSMHLPDGLPFYIIFVYQTLCTVKFKLISKAMLEILLLQACSNLRSQPLGIYFYMLVNTYTCFKTCAHTCNQS